jgi:hypothetical protein
MFVQNSRRNKRDDQPNSSGHDDEIVQATDNGDEIRNEIKRG